MHGMVVEKTPLLVKMQLTAASVEPVARVVAIQHRGGRYYAIDVTSMGADLPPGVQGLQGMNTYWTKDADGRRWLGRHIMT